MCVCGSGVRSPWETEKEEGPGQSVEELQKQRGSWQRRLKRKNWREESRKLQTCRPRTALSEKKGSSQPLNAAEMSGRRCQV